MFERTNEIKIDNGHPNKARGSSGPSIDVPTLERKYVLLYLLDRIGPLRRDQIVALADVIKDDVEQRRPARPLKDVCHDAGFTNGLEGDQFMSHVALEYDLAELTKTFSSKVDNPNDPPSPVDALAGEGSARPILKELYSLRSLGSASAIHTNPKSAEDSSSSTERQSDEFFVPTFKGSAHADAIRFVFSHLDWRRDRDLLVVVRRSGQEFRRPIHEESLQ